MCTICIKSSTSSVSITSCVSDCSMDNKFAVQTWNFVWNSINLSPKYKHVEFHIKFLVRCYLKLDEHIAFMKVTTHTITLEQLYINWFHSTMPLSTLTYENKSDGSLRDYECGFVLANNNWYTEWDYSARPIRREVVSARRLFGAAFSAKMRVCEVIK